MQKIKSIQTTFHDINQRDEEELMGLSADDYIDTLFMVEELIDAFLTGEYLE